MNPAFSLFDMWPALAAGAVGALIPSKKDWKLRAGLGLVGALLVLFTIRTWTGPVVAEGETPREWPNLLNALIFLPLLGALGSNPYWARNWMLFGQPVRPVIGAVLVFERGSGGHVGFAIGQDDTHFHVLGGNQSDAVTIARIAKSRLLGARWPTTWPPRLQRLQTMKPGDLLITTTNEV